MKVIAILLLLVLMKPQHPLAQTDSLQPPEKDIIYITKLIDSLPYFIQSGKVTFSTAGTCVLPDHEIYLTRNQEIVFTKQVLGLSGSKKQDYILMHACARIATELIAKQDYVSAKKWGLKGLDIAIRYGFDYEELHRFRMMINNICFHTGDYEGAMNISTAGLAKSETINDLERMMHYNNVLGYIMMKQKSFEASEKYYLTELDLAKRLADPWEEGHALDNLSDLCIAENKLTEAISFIRKALDVYEEKERVADKDRMQTAIARKAFSFNKLATVYKLMNKNDEALQHSLFSIQISQKPSNHFYGNLYDISSYYINAGDIYNRLLKPDSALFYSGIGLKIADSIKHREYLRDAYEQLSLSFAMKKDFERAYFYQQFFTKLKDNIRDENSRQDILIRDADLRVERERRIQQEELSRQQLWRNIIIGVSVFVIIIIIMLYNRRRIKQKMLYQKELNKKQNELMNTVIAVQDKERKRIAEDLHDTVGSILSAAKLKLSVIAETESGNGTKGKSNYNETLGLIDEAVNEMRSISHNLLPASLLRLGLVAGLKNLFDRISSASELKISFNTYGFEERIDETIEVSIYRIILEAINNVVRHAGAKNVTVQLMQYETYINILVEDDGVGFDKKMIAPGQGIGLNNIISRVDHMRGHIDIDTKPKAGTIINIDIPY